MLLPCPVVETCSHAIPIPSLTILADETVAQVMARIQAEAGFESVVLQDHDQGDIPADEYVVALADRDCIVTRRGGNEADRSFWRVAPVEKRPGRPMEGSLSVPEIMRKSAVLAISKQLRGLHERAIPLERFLSICGQQGLAAAHGIQLAKDLHRVGQVLHFHQVQ